MIEKLEIQNFGGIRHAEIEVGGMTILIGPQASGKSVTAKLLYFFKGIAPRAYDQLRVGSGLDEIQDEALTKFVRYFPRESWTEGDFQLSYWIGDLWMKIHRKKDGHVELNFSDQFTGVVESFDAALFKEKFTVSGINDLREGQKKEVEHRAQFNRLVNDRFGEKVLNEQIFIPAGRSFFSSLRSSIFSVLSEGAPLDPFLIEFGALYERQRSLFNLQLESVGDALSASAPLSRDIIEQILGASYAEEKGKHYLVHQDGRKVNLAFASSGQQETLPLLMLLIVMGEMGLSRHGVTLYIEEPEAHLFPTAQKRVVEVLSQFYNESQGRVQIVITTHSPYILSSMNNLIEADNVASNLSPDEKERLFKIIPENRTMSFDDLSAYALSGGKVERILDKEFRLISSDILDDVSNDIAIEFGALLDLE